MNRKTVALFFFLVVSTSGFAQNSVAKKKLEPSIALPVINPEIPVLIPNKKEGKLGYINQKGKVIIPHEYSNGGMFAEDCNLLNSPNEKVRVFGSSEYASVTKDKTDYRISKTGKKVYQFKKEDLSQCKGEFRKQKYHAFVKSGFYGIIEDEKFKDANDYRHFKIYPQYHYLHIMESKDLDNPMILAGMNDFFGVINKDNQIIVPFEYKDIKPNYSWYLANLFEVTKDGKNYYYIDAENRSYK